MTENDYIALYIKKRKPEILNSFDYIAWRLCKEAGISVFPETFSKRLEELEMKLNDEQGNSQSSTEDKKRN